MAMNLAEMLGTVDGLPYGAETDKEYAIVHKDEIEARRKARLDRFFMTCPKRYQSAEFSNFEDFGDEAYGNALKQATEELSNLHGGIILGGNGTGKTRLGWATLRVACMRGMSIMYTTLYEYMDGMKQGWKQGSDFPLRERCRNADYLVIDEVDKGYGTDSEYLALTDLVNKRYNDMKPTLLLSNASDFQTFSQIVGNAVADRIREDGFLCVLRRASVRRDMRLRRQV